MDPEEANAPQPIQCRPMIGKRILRGWMTQVATGPKADIFSAEDSRARPQPAVFCARSSRRIARVNETGALAICRSRSDGLRYSHHESRFGGPRAVR